MKKKTTSLHHTDEHKQQRIIKNYENGLKTLPDVFGKNMQYMLLLPRCYKLKKYTFDQNTSEVIDANLLFEERLHPDFKYIIKMDLINKTRQDAHTDIIQSTSAENLSPTNT